MILYKINRYWLLYLVCVCSASMISCGEEIRGKTATASVAPGTPVTPVVPTLPVTAAALTGNWKLTAFKVDPPVNFFDLPVNDYIEAGKRLGITCLTDLTLTLKNDGSVASDNPRSCQTDSTGLTEATGINANGIWTLSGNKLTITDTNGDSTEYEVTRTESAMSWTTKADGADPGTGKAITYTATLTWRRA